MEFLIYEGLAAFRIRVYEINILFNKYYINFPIFFS